MSSIIPANWVARLKAAAGWVAAVGASVSAVLAVVLNTAHAINLPKQDIAIIVTVSSVVAAIVADAAKITNGKLTERKAAKAK